MHPLLFATTGTVISTPDTDAAMPFSSNSKPKSSNHAHISNCNSHSLSCKHSSSATLDLLILILVLFSGAFLLSSYFSYIFNSLSLLSHFTPQLYQLPTPQILGFIIFFVISILLVLFCCGARSRKCGKPGCKGLKKAMEFDLQLQTEESLKTGSDEIDKLPWKGGSENNPDYECLSSELRNMAPPGGRAVLLFRTKCGCPVAKLEGWGPRKGKRHKKSLPNRILNGGGDHP
ncbi:uncharacterized protein At5g19025-like isoform X2 [Neltuma alba]|uniref:uncharacterized protein At5g19025-like isoform X2 n=1 Tax=Neltuma alba TaxID=207710 RepID=UPI0010A48EE0|nr:uncharacterized protein At5g19025-like isoform X2 [Prosopis alba]